MTRLAGRGGLQRGARRCSDNPPPTLPRRLTVSDHPLPPTEGDAPAAAPTDETPAAPAASTPTASPAATAAQLAPLFPAAFGPGVFLPLKLGIQADIQQRAPGVFTKKSLSAFLHRHTTSTAYLKALVGAAQRVDLDGQPAGDVADLHRTAATGELERRRALHDARRAAERQAQRAAHDEARQAHSAAEAGAARARGAVAGLRDQHADAGQLLRAQGAGGNGPRRRARPGARRAGPARLATATATATAAPAATAAGRRRAGRSRSARRTAFRRAPPAARARPAGPLRPAQRAAFGGARRAGAAERAGAALVRATQTL